MKYIKLFDKLFDFENVKDDLDRPNVSLIQENNKIEYLAASNIDYSKEYFTIEAIEDSTFKLTQNACQYSLDEGCTWVSLAAGINTQTVPAGNKIMFKATNPTISMYYGIGTFSSTGKFNVEGNIMSMLYGDDFEGQTDLTGKDYAFYDLFINCINIVDASNLILPATTLASYCYNSMFQNCTSLTTAPELPATTLATGCYAHMFQNCTSLTTAPELPATTLAKNCYNGMFYGCTSLTTAPELPATTLADGCYKTMFYKCSKLNYIKALFTTTHGVNVGGLYTSSWVAGVSSTGTFVKHPDMTSLPSGMDGIPEGWGIAYNNSGFCIVNQNTSKNIVFYDQYGKLYTPSNKAKNLYNTMSTEEIMLLKPECDIKVTVVVDEKDIVIKNQLWSSGESLLTLINNSLIIQNKPISITINEILSPNGDYGYYDYCYYYY